MATRKLVEEQAITSALGGTDISAELLAELVFDHPVKAVLEIGVTPITLALSTSWTDVAPWTTEEMARNCTTALATGSIIVPVDAWYVAHFAGTIENVGVAPVDVIAEAYIYRPGTGAIEVTKGAKATKPVQAVARNYASPLYALAGDEIRWRMATDSGTSDVDIYRAHFWLDRFE